MSTHLDVDRRFTVCPLLGSGARCGRVSVSRATAGPTSVTPTRRQVVDGVFFLLLVSCVVFISLAGFGLIFLFFSCSGASEVALYIARLIGLRFFFFSFFPAAALRNAKHAPRPHLVLATVVGAFRLTHALPPSPPHGALVAPEGCQLSNRTPFALP